MSDFHTQHVQTPPWQRTPNDGQATHGAQQGNGVPAIPSSSFHQPWSGQVGQYSQAGHLGSLGGVASTTYNPSQQAPAPSNFYGNLTNEVPTKDFSTPNSYFEPANSWDQVVQDFLKALGFTQALAGFEADMLVMNSEWEQKKVPDALSKLAQQIPLLYRYRRLAPRSVRARDTASTNGAAELSNNAALDERKLKHAHFAEGAKLRTPTKITNEISAFLARNRARNDASNRTEFLRSLAEKRAALGAGEPGSDAGSSSTDPIASCARVDAKPIDRDVQMKYDIAKNEEGPLSRTVAHPSIPSNDKGKGKATETEDVALYGTDAGRERSSIAVTDLASDERLQNIEKHFSVRYVPSPPVALMDRLKLLEEHIIRLEKDYPPWAALHFNQPNRGWPPPPRATPIIVPSHMKRLPPAASSEAPSGLSSSTPHPDEGSRQGSEGPTKSKKSSLHRAVMEKLEVKQAMADLAGRPS